MGHSNAVDLVTSETPEGHPERSERLGAAREVDFVTSSFPDKRPWTIDGFATGTKWPEEHDALFLSALDSPDEYEELGFGSTIVCLEQAEHTGDASDLLDVVRKAWEGDGRTVHTLTERVDNGSETYIWSIHSGLKTELAAYVSSSETLFRLTVELHGPRLTGLIDGSSRA